MILTLHAQDYLRVNTGLQSIKLGDAITLVIGTDAMTRLSWEMDNCYTIW